MQVFTDVYANTSVYQLPLLQGAPSSEALAALNAEPCDEWLERSLATEAVSVRYHVTQFEEMVTF